MENKNTLQEQKEYYEAIIQKQNEVIESNKLYIRSQEEKMKQELNVINKEVEVMRKKMAEVTFTEEQRQDFEYAAQLEGFTEFHKYIVYALEEQSKQNRIKFGAILATPRDKQVFFDAIENPREPNQNLIDAFKKSKYFFEED